MQERLRFGPIDALVTITVISMAVWWFGLTDGSWFFADEWRLARRGHTFGDFFGPYNGHLSITPIALYRVHYGLFGFSHYEVLRAIGVVALASVPAALYVTTRRRVPPVAAGLCAVLLVMSTRPGLEPGGMNHNLALTFGLIAAWAMSHQGRRYDLLVAASLFASIASAGDALPFAIALLVLCAIGRVSLQRWIAVVVPFGLWGLWHTTIGATDRLISKARVGLVDKFLLAPRSLPETLRGLTAGSTPAALLLAVGLVVAIIYKLRTGGRPGVASTIAWLAAWWAWWFGLADARGVLAFPQIFRYRFAASVFLALAVLPTGLIDRRSARGAHRDRTPTTLRHQWLGVGALALLTVTLAFANRSAVRETSRQLNAFGAEVEEQFLVATAVPTVVPPEYVHPFALGGLTQQELLDVVAGFGPKPLTAAQLDARFVENGSVYVSAVGVAADDPTCDPRPYQIRSRGEETRLSTADEPAWVHARLFGDDEVPLVELPARSTVSIRPPTDVFGRQWVLTTGPVCVGP